MPTLTGLVVLAEGLDMFIQLTGAAGMKRRMLSRNWLFEKKNSDRMNVEPVKDVITLAAGLCDHKHNALFNCTLLLALQVNVKLSLCMPWKHTGEVKV